MDLILKRRLAAFMSFILLLMVVTGCDDSEPAPPTKLQLQADYMEIAANADVYKISYVLDNPVSGIELSVKSNQEWIHSFDTKDDDAISFQVDENTETTPREAILDIVYGDAKASLQVKQEGAKIPDFGIILDPNNITEASATYTVTPADCEMNYLSMVVEASEFDAFNSDEDYFQNDLNYFRTTAESQSKTLEEYLAAILKKGEVTASVYNLSPDKTYYAYVYGLTPQGERTTNIYKQQFQTKSVEIISAPFEISFKVKHSDVQMNVNPGSYDGYYMFDLVEASSVSDEASLVKMMQDYIDNYINIYSLIGVNPAEAVTRFASRGSASYLYDKDTNIKPYTEYIGFALAITPLGKICSQPVTAKVTTEAATPDVDELKITLSDITTESVVVNVKSSIDDHYVVGITSSYIWEGMTDEEILATLVNGYEWQARGATGDFETTFYGCQPKNSYSVFAFGYVNGESTTRLYRADFTAAEGTEANISFKFCYDKYFDGSEMAELDAYFAPAKNRAVLPFQIESEGDDLMEVYYSIYEGDLTDTQLNPDSELLPSLWEDGLWEMDGNFILSYDVDYTVVGFSVNTNEETGPISRVLINLNRDGVSPATEYGLESKTKYIATSGHRAHKPSIITLTTDQLIPTSNIPTKQKVTPKLLRPFIQPSVF